MFRRLRPLLRRRRPRLLLLRRRRRAAVVGGRLEGEGRTRKIRRRKRRRCRPWSQCKLSKSSPPWWQTVEDASTPSTPACSSAPRPPPPSAVASPPPRWSASPLRPSRPPSLSPLFSPFQRTKSTYTTASQPAPNLLHLRLHRYESFFSLLFPVFTRTALRLLKSLLTVSLGLLLLC